MFYFLSYIAPWAIAPILIIGGGLILAYKGLINLENLVIIKKMNKQLKESSNEFLKNQKSKKLLLKQILFLSFEIIVISLSLLDNSDFITKLMVLISVGIFNNRFSIWNSCFDYKTR